MIGACLEGLGRYEEAEPLLVGSFPALHRQWGDRDYRLRAAAHRIVALYETWGKPDMAAEYRAWGSSSPQR